MFSVLQIHLTSPFPRTGAEYFFQPNSFLCINYQSWCLCLLSYVCAAANRMFSISCCKWAYLSWHHQHYMCLLMGSLLTNHSLTLSVYPPWLPWGRIKTEASLEDTFWGLVLTAWSRWCTCQKHAAFSHVKNWLVQELWFLRVKLRCGGVSGTCTEPPELTWDPKAQQNYQTYFSLCFLPFAKILSLLCNGLMQKNPQTSILQGDWSERGL